MGSASSLSPLGLTSNVCPSISPVYRPLCDSPSRVATRVPSERARDFWVLPQRHCSFPHFSTLGTRSIVPTLFTLLACLTRLAVFAFRAFHRRDHSTPSRVSRLQWRPELSGLGLCVCVCVCATRRALRCHRHRVLSSVHRSLTVHKWSVSMGDGESECCAVLCSAYAHSRAADMSRAKS